MKYIKPTGENTLSNTNQDQNETGCGHTSPISEIQIPEEQFGVAEFFHDRMPHVVCMNLSILEVEPKQSFAWYLSLVVPVKEPNESGMPDGDEVIDLQDFCERLDLKIKYSIEHPNAVFLGRITGKGFMQCMWYVNNPETTHSLLQRIIENEDFQFDFEYEIHHDPEWEQAHCWLD